MIFFVEAAAFLFIIYSAVKGTAYGIYNIKEKNIPGGIMVFALTLFLFFLLGYSFFGK